MLADRVTNSRPACRHCGICESLSLPVCGDEVLARFRQQVHLASGGNYQTVINEALCQHIQASRESLKGIP